MNQIFDGFYKKTAAERLEILHGLGWSKIRLNEDDNTGIEEVTTVEGVQLPGVIANQMIENYLFNYQLPLGVAVNFIVNDIPYSVPMVIEEPSVIAAASNGAKKLGNIQTVMEKRDVIGQVVLANVIDTRKIEQIIMSHQDELLKVARSASQNMVKRGGGPRNIWTKSYSSQETNFTTIYLSFNPCEAMGANALNTVLEAITPVIERLTGHDGLMSILSNYATEAVVKARCEVPIISLHADVIEADTIARKITLASDYAQLDPYRATTQNKGIMNGIDAVLIATGNDWRAVEAGVHAYASKSGQYRSLTRWFIDQETNELIGEIELPLQLATVGGTISVHPTAQWALGLMHHPTANELAEVVAAVGLAQNFAAIRALVTEGIQKGHMALQARSLALQVGAELTEIDEVVRQLGHSDIMNSTTAKKILEDLRK
ncbi:hydroxymethylglutaryl-CoA reductase, degradative [Fundicoccus sp. Sow4_D5]|uniref:hydroxymethylglutaryl-CoA reductase, degradative n=1 Tax=unclassified Fundicoccus TaxID=2761543 RepID=UPI003F8FEFB8